MMRWLPVLCMSLLLLGAAVPVLGQGTAPGTSPGAPQPVQPGHAPDPALYAERADLATPGSLDGAKRVLRFVQVSDAHILDDDAPAPLRVEPLDDYITVLSTSAQRPQEEFTDEVLESIVRSINAQHALDPFQFVINTGDNIDNDLENELMRFLDLWDGTTTTVGPLSGRTCPPDGQSVDLADTAHDVANECTSLPESLRAQRTALAPGLPWYSAFGNHDAQIQGNVMPNQAFDAIAGQFGRRLLTQPEYVAMHFPGLDACTGGSASDDFGHGYGLAGDRLCDEDPDNDGYYSFALNGVRVIVLDTVNDDIVAANGFNPNTVNVEALVGADVIGGYAEGSIDPAQLTWLRGELDQAEEGQQLAVVFSHHTVNSMFTNLADGYCAPGLGCLADVLDAAGYGTGATLAAELAEDPRLVGWFGGHTHRHRIEAKDGAEGGFWNVETSSLVDWPQEARVVELWVTANGAKGVWVLDDFGHDFELSKTLELTDDQRVESAIGDEDDQDTLLWFDIPFRVDLVPQPHASIPWSVDFDAPTTRDQGKVDHEAPYALGIVELNFTAKDQRGVALPPFLFASVADENPLGLRDYVTANATVRQGGIPIATPTVDLREDLSGATLVGQVGRFVAEAPGDVTVEVDLVLHRDGLPPEHHVASTTFPVGKQGAGAKDSPGLPIVALLGLVAVLVALRRR